VMNRDGMFLMLGVRYEYLTALHVSEVELGVPYRDMRIAKRWLRKPDGSTVLFSSRVYPPSGEDPIIDFNRVGRMLEEAGKVKIGAAGNAVARLFQGQQIRAMARVAYERDPNVFVVHDGKPQQLPDGNTVKTVKGYVSVVDPKKIYVSR
jgi:aminoglycoside N3'-acetyltransferase